MRTKHFGIELRPEWLGGDPPRWYAWSFRIGFVRATVDYLPFYRYAFGLDFWLIPNFIWWQDYLGEERGRHIYHARIVGIQSWPFDCWFVRS